MNDDIKLKKNREELLKRTVEYIQFKFISQAINE